MKFISTLSLAIGTILLTSGMPPKPANLCLVGETTIFSFRTKGGKTAALCQGPKGNYLVYRFGTVTKVELQYPATLDARSWQKFTFWSYTRGGGAHNSGLETAQLRFKNQNVEYKLSDQVSSFYNEKQEEDERREVGIEVNVKGRTISIDGEPDMVVGNLFGLKYDGKVKLEDY